MLIKLWHFQTKNKVPDTGWIWCFWQSSPPYKLQGEYISCMVPVSSFCEVFALGGSDRLWSGLLSDVPSKFRSYLTEVRVQVN
jgi:hypothetical protein